MSVKQEMIVSVRKSSEVSGELLILESWMFKWWVLLKIFYNYACRGKLGSDPVRNIIAHVIEINNSRKNRK